MKLKQLRGYFRANPGTLFIVAFQVLLMTAAVLLVLGNSPVANEVAVYAFYAVVIGVVLQIVIVVREERKRTRADSGVTHQAS